MKLESGITIDYLNDQFEINIVDEVFAQEEIENFRKNACLLYYVNKGLVDLFLINIDDCLETSDIPYCIYENISDEVLKMLESTDNLTFKISLLDCDGNSISTRSGTCDQEMSKIIRDTLKMQLEKEFDEEVYETTLDKIWTKYEPFEMEEHALAKCNL